VSAKPFPDCFAGIVVIVALTGLLQGSAWSETPTVDASTRLEPSTSTDGNRLAEEAAGESIWKSANFLGVFISRRLLGRPLADRERLDTVLLCSSMLIESSEPATSDTPSDSLLASTELLGFALATFVSKSRNFEGGLMALREGFFSCSGCSSACSCFFNRSGCSCFCVFANCKLIACISLLGVSSSTLVEALAKVVLDTLDEARLLRLLGVV
jgi:hypothetical protein